MIGDFDYLSIASRMPFFFSRFHISFGLSLPFFFSIIDF